MDCPSARVRSEVFGHCIANVKCDAFASNGGQTTAACLRVQHLHHAAVLGLYHHVMHMLYGQGYEG
jgi:hypothetical protein